MEDYKGNSNASKEAPSEEKRVTQPVTTKVTEKKPSFFGKIKKKMFSDDAGHVGEYVVSDVIIPKLQGMFSDAFKFAIDFIFYGKGTGNNSNRRNGIGTISYSSYYNQNSNNIPQIPASAYKQNSVFTVRNFVFDERWEAINVIEDLREIIDRYGSASAGDFYDLINQSHTYTDMKYGWKDLSQVEAIRDGGGWVINFPKAIPLE